MNCTDLENIYIPNSITKINYSAFSGCSSLKEVILPNSLQEIGINTFRFCTSLTTLNIPASVTTIGDEGNGAKLFGADFSSQNSASVILTVDPNNPNYSAYEGNLYNKDQTVLLEVTNHTPDPKFPDTMTTIGANAFEGSNIESITIPNSVTTIGRGAFSKADKLKNVTFGTGVTTIEDGAFSHRYEDRMTSITLPPNLKTIGAGAFSGQGFTSLTIPAGVTEIGAGAFSGNEITSITIPASVTQIGSGAFRCETLTSVTFESAGVNLMEEVEYSRDDEETVYPFYGDLKAKYAKGGKGTYTRPANSQTWTKK
jgi:GH24 family phage-related lysozyme (muramidase)